MHWSNVSDGMEPKPLTMVCDKCDRPEPEGDCSSHKVCTSKSSSAVVLGSWGRVRLCSSCGGVGATPSGPRGVISAAFRSVGAAEPSKTHGKIAASSVRCDAARVPSNQPRVQKQTMSRPPNCEARRRNGMRDRTPKDSLNGARYAQDTVGAKTLILD